MSRYKAYPEYKDSGVEWLDRVPTQWQSVPIKYTALCPSSLFLDGDWIESKDISGDEIRYITTGNVGEGFYREQGVGFISEEKFVELDCTEVLPGDILISRLNAPIGRSCIVPELESRIVTSVDNVIYRPDSIFDKKFLVHLFSSADYFAHTANLARGATMQRISRGLLGNIRIVVPSHIEQQKIANFLDHETAKIDTLIAKQQELIKLLKEKRQAVISHAVTKGLNPNAPMRDSGVEWLGEVPMHWRVKRLKHLVVTPLMYGANEAAIDANLSNPRFIRITDIQDDGNLRSDTFCSLAEEVAAPYLLRAGDILLARTGGTVGKSFIYDTAWGRCCFAGYLIKASLNESELLAKWFFLFTQTLYYWKWIGSNQIQATLQNVSADKYNNFTMTVPPLEEQQEILHLLDASIASLEKSISKAELAISLMQERRTALISAAVTGKIDVRDWNRI